MNEKPDVGTSMFVTCIDIERNIPITNLTNIFDVSIRASGDDMALILKTSRMTGLTPSKRYHVCVLLTTDPTPESAMDTVSLSYPMQRWTLKDCVLESVNPFIFKGSKNNFISDMLLEMWEDD